MNPFRIKNAGHSPLMGTMSLRNYFSAAMGFHNTVSILKGHRIHASKQLCFGACLGVRKMKKQSLKIYIEGNCISINQ